MPNTSCRHKSISSIRLSSANENHVPSCLWEAKIFLIGGAGYGVKYYRALQKANIAFSAGILWENDMDFAVASVLAEEVVSVKPFTPITEEEIAKAKQIIDRADAVFNCGCPIGDFNRANEELLQYAGDKVRKELPL